ncbi:MAG: HAD family hydrolase [Lachnospiraceae bacterium]|jgi:phosphoglycolate phosphatase
MENHKPENGYRTAVFDLDGTILDTLDDLYHSVNTALRSQNLPERSRAEVRSFVGNGIRRLMRLSVPAGTPDEIFGRAFDAFREDYAVHCADATAPYPGIPELLGRLREKGIRLAVVSNKADGAVQKLIARYFPGMFDSVAGEQPGVRRKPAPDTVNRCLKELSADRAEAVYIGDSEVDLRTAENAHMDLILVDWGFRDRSMLEKSGAPRIVSTAEQLEKAISG